jgi:hypothetical protein
MMEPIYKGGDQSVTENYSQISLISVVCKEMEHAIEGI